MRIKDWPEGDRPREMLLEKGPEALSDAALLAILLRTGRQGKNAIALAREMINRFGGLNRLMMATQEDLLSVKGIGKAKMAQILAAMEIVKRRLRQPLEKINIIENPRDLFEYLRASMSNLSREEFRLLHLNRSKHLIAEEVLFRKFTFKERSIAELMELFKWQNRTKFRTKYIKPLIDVGWLTMTIPDKPQSSKQRYITTETGKEALKT